LSPALTGRAAMRRASTLSAASWRRSGWTSCVTSSPPPLVWPCASIRPRALSARSTSRPKAATRTMSPARGIVAGTTGIIEMSNGRPTMRNHLDRMHDQTLAHVASLSNSDILSKSPDEWVAQLVQEFASPEIPVLDLTKISRTAEQGEVPAYAVPNLKFSTHVPRVQGLIHHIHVPFTGDRNFFHCHPAGWVDEFPGAAVGADELILAIGGGGEHTTHILRKIHPHNTAPLYSH